MNSTPTHIKAGQMKPQWIACVTERNHVGLPRNKTQIQLASHLHARKPAMPVLHEECFRAQSIFLFFFKTGGFSVSILFQCTSDFKPPPHPPPHKKGKSIDFLASVSSLPLDCRVFTAKDTVHNRGLGIHNRCRHYRHCILLKTHCSLCKSSIAAASTLTIHFVHGAAHKLFSQLIFN